MNILKPFHLDKSIVTQLIIGSVLISKINSNRHKHFFGMFLLYPFGIIRNKEYYRLLSSGFVHVDRLHLFSNLLMLFLTTISLEKYLAELVSYGHILFGVVYLGCHLIGAILVTGRHFKDPTFSSAGASGSIMGCLFCLMILQPNFVAFYLPVIGPVSNWYASLIFILLLIRLQHRQGSLYNHEMHLYSGLAGVCSGLLIKHFVI
jgi:membrane associated rhomboid family serine protease